MTSHRLKHGRHWRTERPLVSVIIPCLNSAETISRAIESVLEQDYRPLEIIVIDDASADKSVDIAESVLKGRIPYTIVKLAENRGASAARNAGINVASGEFVAFLDSDDLWLPGKISTQVMILIARPNVSLVTCNTRKIDANGQVVLTGYDIRPPVEGSAAWKGLLAYNFIPTPTVVTRLSLLKALGGFDEAMIVGEDLDLWIRIGLRGEIVALPAVYVHYFDYPNSLMKRENAGSAPRIMKMVLRHMNAGRARLTKFEFNRLVGHRSFELAGHAFLTKDFESSRKLYWSALSVRYRVFKSLAGWWLSAAGLAWSKIAAPRSTTEATRIES